MQLRTLAGMCARVTTFRLGAAAQSVIDWYIFHTDKKVGSGLTEYQTGPLKLQVLNQEKLKGRDQGCRISSSLCEANKTTTQDANLDCFHYNPVVCTAVVQHDVTDSEARKSKATPSTYKIQAQHICKILEILINV